jgi:plastocyanin
MAVPRTTIRRASLLAAALLLLSTALAACGGSSGGSTTTAQPSASRSAAASTTSATASAPAAAGTTLAIGAVEKGGDQLGFTSRQLTARAGTVTIKVANGARNEYPHGIAIEGNGVDKDGAIVKPGNGTSVSVTLRPGRYTFYCPVHEHEKYGMKGTLTVT